MLQLQKTSTGKALGMENDSVKDLVPSDILDTAHDLIFRRGALYGHYEDNLARIAATWSAYLNQEIDAHQVATLYALAKIIRSVESRDHLDNYFDAVAYLAMAGCTTRPKREDDGYGDLS